jgi:hypothetical protein
MPPRRSARVAAVVERETSALPPLPLPVVLHVFSLLPVDCRLRCAEVCRGWRAVLSERSLWTRLDLTRASGMRVREGNHARGVLDRMLRCAAARAGGLQSLHIDVRNVSHATLLEVAAANADALRELHVHGKLTDDLGFDLEHVEPLLGAAPLLRTLAIGLNCDNTELRAVRRMLRNDAPFAPLRVVYLCANLRNKGRAGVVAFAADVAAHASLTGLTLEEAPLDTPAALDAVVDAALARRMQRVGLWDCGLSPESAPALARLLDGGALTTLECWHMDALDAPAARVLAAALRASSALTSLTLNRAGVFRDAAVTAELLGALTGHASLRTLSLQGNDTTAAADQAAMGALLGAMVAANAPALTELDVSWCVLGDDGLRALFEALPRNTHLRKLVAARNMILETFAHDVLLPAVRANASLRQLRMDEFYDSERDAEELVRRRAAA